MICMNTNPLELLIATGNPGKVRELKMLLSDLPFTVRSLSNVSHTEVEETGSTFAENAALKAIGYAKQAGMWALADDSGLEVESLDGAPGVLSARYGGSNTDYLTKIQLLLAEIGNSERAARFVCTIAVANPSGQLLATANGICTGRIADAPSGTGGFGYDPIFIPTGFDQSFGELASDIKSQISHRARAYREILSFLRGLT